MEQTDKQAFVLRVACEVARLEVNLARLDPSVRCYKQLSRAVQRIKDAMRAEGYEYVDMLGMDYDEGMRVIADFTSDDTLPQGTQRITGITRPQVNRDGMMIQAAQITVSQNIE